jgi:APA family basic amino acid/polyamine antiporter
LSDQGESKGKMTSGVFTRSSTGLVKSISALDVFSFTLLAAGPMVLIPLGVLTLPSVYEGASIPLILGISIVLLLALAYNTVALSSALPRAGGDYVFGSRVVHPVWGMIPSFMVLFSFVIGIGTLAVVTLQAFLGPAILTSFPQYAPVVVNLFYSSGGNLFAIAVLVLIFIFGLAAVSTRAWFWLIKFVSIFAFLMLIVFLAFLLTTNHNTLVANFNSQNATGYSFAQVEDVATASNWSPNVQASALTTAGAMIFVFFFLAAPISAYFSGEIKNTARSMLAGMLGGTVFSWAIASIGILAFVTAFGYQFLSAYGFNSLSNPSVFGVNALILASVPNPDLAFLIGLGFSVATLGLVAAPILPASRILFAWSFDRMIPERFSSVSERTHTPIFSIIVVAVLTILVAGLDVLFSSTFGTFVATTIIVAIAFLPNGVTAALLPFRRKEVYETSPGLVKIRVGSAPLITLTGLVHAIGFAVLIALVFLNPAASGTSNGSLGGGPLAVVAIGLLFALIFYPVAKEIRKSSGIDLGLTFKEIPPE